MKRGRIAFAVVCLLGASLALSTIHPWGNPRTSAQPGVPLLGGSQAPPRVLAALETKCGNCHSETTRYPLYSHLAPVSWMIERDIVAARSHLDMSRWQFYADEERANALTRIASEVRAGEMPPTRYRLLHPSAGLSPAEQQLVYDWAKSERRRLRSSSSTPTDSSVVNPRAPKP